MWIERLEIAGYGRLRGSFHFEQGLTVVRGPNEAGKSTLHDALVHSMFGFSESERKRKGGEREMLYRAPWDGGPFGLVARMRLVGDRQLRVEWTFGPEREQELVLLDARTGEDLTREVAARGGGDYTLGDYLLGVDIDSYRQWGCLGQAAGGRARGDEGFVADLRNASETGSEETGVDEARKLIEAARKSEAIGARANTHTPLKDRAYAIATARWEELGGLIVGAEATQVELASEAVELERIEADEVDLRGRIAALEGERLAARRLSLKTTLDRAREAGERAGIGAPDAAPEVPAELAGEARSLHGRIEELRTLHAEATVRQRAASAELANLIAESGTLETEIQGLAAYGSVDASQEGRIGALLGGLLEREQTLAATAPVGAPSAGPAGGRSATPSGAQLPGEDRPVQAPGPGGEDAARATASRAQWAVPTAIAVASVAGGLLVSPVLLAGLGVAAAAYWWLRERRGADQGAERARADAARQAELAREQARLETQQRSHAAAAARLREIQAELGAALDRVGAAPGDPRSRAEGYLEACRQAERLAALNARRAELAERIRVQNEPAAEIQRIDGEIETRSERLQARLHSFGITVVGAEGIAELDRMEDVGRRARERRMAVEEADRSLRTILDGRSIEEVEASLRDVEGELAGRGAQVGTLEQTPRTEAQVAGDLDAATTARAEATGRLGTARQKVADLEARLVDLPAWRAEKEATGARIARIEFAIEALKVADEQLAEAATEAHRRSVPGLNRAINDELPRLTEGRYTEATVDENLEITLVAPEVNRAVSAERLSQGTQDQIYLVERLAILELLSQGATEPPPLLLDDAFAHFDATRRRAALRLLAEKATQRQVVLFVDEPEVAEELEGLGVEFETVELPGPGERIEA